jgi:hypothetical protein
MLLPAAAAMVGEVMTALLAPWSLEFVFGWVLLTGSAAFEALSGDALSFSGYELAADIPIPPEVTATEERYRR